MIRYSVRNVVTNEIRYFSTQGDAEKWVDYMVKVGPYNNRAYRIGGQFYSSTESLLNNVNK